MPSKVKMPRRVKMPKSVGFTVIKEECLSWHLPDWPRSAFLTRADLVVFAAVYHS